MRKNILTIVDSYKISHWKCQAPGTERVYSYFESRGGDFPYTVFFGLQYLLKEYFEGVAFTKEDIDEAEELYALHFGSPDIFNRKGWEYVLGKYGGCLPLRILAVPEGSVIPNRHALMTVENTDKQCSYMTNVFETLLSHVWYPTTVATQSHVIKKMMLQFAEETGDPASVDFRLHCFGARGGSSVSTVAVGSLSHLINFRGTDTVPALMAGREYYDCKMCGFSIPATEHSLVTSFPGGRDGEGDAFENFLNQFPEGTVACVSDSYDIYHAISELWGTRLHDKIMNRNGTLVVRPDSGDPKTIVLECLRLLGEKFPVHINSKGYKVLDSHVRLIQGDGVNIDSIREILTEMKAQGWSIDNISFGMGGKLLQAVNRDTLKFAFKCSSVTINGEEHDVYKDPITDPGKASKRGRLVLVKTADNSYVTLPEDQAVMLNDQEHFVPMHNELIPVFENGEILREYTFDEVRKNAWG